MTIRMLGRRARQFCLVLTIAALALSLTGCFSPGSQTDLVGTYLIKYPDGSEELTLAEDGTFHQVVRIVGWSPVLSQGEWRYEKDGYLILEAGYLLAHDSAGKLVQSVEDWRKGRASLSVTKIPFGTTHIMQSEYYSYAKQD